MDKGPRADATCCYHDGSALPIVHRIAGASVALRHGGAADSVSFAVADGARAGTSAHQSLVFAHEPLASSVPYRSART